VVGAALLSGILLGLAGPPLEWPFLLPVALIPLMLVLLHPGTEVRRGAAAALGAAFVHNLVRAAVLLFPLHFALLLGISLSLLWLPLGIVVPLLGRRLPRFAAVIVAPAAVVAVEYLGVTLVPMFGTAESFGRALAPWPFALASAAFVGFAGPVALLAALQSGLAFAWLERAHPRRIGLGVGLAATSVALAVTAGAVRLGTPPVQTVRVAAVGWTYGDEGSPWEWRGRWAEQIQVLLEPAVREAAAGGAALLVAPEVAFALAEGDRAPFMAAVEALAREAEISLVVGYFDDPKGVNEALAVGPGGQPVTVYRKTHLIPFMEDYAAGTGQLAVTTGPLGATGMLICQDDNFPDLARGYSRAGVVALAIPTNDWDLVEAFHLQNTVLRAVDSGVAVVRGASNGISAVIDGRGRILATREHHREGTGIVFADLPLYPPGTPFARVGNVLPVACLLLLAGCAAVGRRRP